MGQLLIGDVEEELVQELERRARANGRTPEEEVCEILRQALEEEGRKTAPRAIR